MRFRFALALSLLLLMVSAPAARAGGGGGGELCRAYTSGRVVSLRDVCFDGVVHFAQPGTKLEIVNNGTMNHDVNAVDGSFASGILGPGDTYEITLGHAGVVHYYCSLHGNSHGYGMAGVIVVGSRSATPFASDAAHGNSTAALALALVAAVLVIGAAVAYSISERPRRRV